MYARYTMAQYRRVDRATAESAADHVDALLRQQKGFKGCTWLFDHDTSEYGVLSLWETREAADAAATAIAAEVEQIFARLGVVAREPLTPQPAVASRLFEVYTPRTLLPVGR